MALPEKLAQAEKDVELLVKQMAGTEGEPTPPNPEPPTEEPTPPTPPETEVVEKKEPVVTPEPEPEDPNSLTYKQRWETLQGMYKADLARDVEHATQTYKDELGRKDQVIGTLVNQIESQKTVTPEPQAQEPEPEPPQPPQEEIIEPPELQEIKPVDREEVVDILGDEAGVLADAINTLTAENQKVMNYAKSQAEKIRKQQEQIQNLTTQLGGVGQSVNQIAQETKQGKQDAFYSRLKELSPEWESYNKNDAFNAWLDSPVTIPELPGQVFKRREFFNKAAQAGDVNQVASFFNEGINAVKTSVQTPAQGEGVVTTPTEPTEGDTTLLEEQVMPAQSGGGVGDVTVDPNAVNLAELQKKMSKAAEKVAQARTHVQREQAQEKYDKIADTYQKAYAKLIKK